MVCIVTTTAEVKGAWVSKNSKDKVSEISVAINKIIFSPGPLISL